MTKSKTPEMWLRRYYQTPADKVPKKEAIRHSLRKWRGLRVIEDYGLDVSSGSLFSKDTKELVLEVGSDTCALCVHYFDGSKENMCQKCPLAKVRGGIPCDGLRLGEHNHPFSLWGIKHDPEPMIKWLRQALAAQEPNK